GLAETRQMLGDPLGLAARHDPDAKIQPARLVEVVADSGPELLDGHELIAPAPPRRVDGLAVDRRADERLEFLKRIEAAERPHAGDPALELQLVPVLVEDLLPRAVGRALG